MAILVTRPKGKEASLITGLQAEFAEVYYQPIIDIAPGPDIDKVEGLLADKAIDILIFVSTFAVDYFASSLKNATEVSGYPIQWLAVGQSSARRLQQRLGVEAIYPKLETSEGLLALPQLQQAEIADKKILIVRGVGGRELLHQQLKSKQGQVAYLELYQRRVIEHQGQNWFDQWQANKIDCIIVTSVAILTAIFDSFPDAAMHWLRSRHWIVASQRIGDTALKRGVAPQLITDAKGAGDSALIAAVKRVVES